MKILIFVSLCVSFLGQVHSQSLNREPGANDTSKEELEKLVPQLISQMESNDSLAMENAIATFKLKFSEKIFKFDTPPFPDDPYDKDRIVIQDSKIATKLLKYFGDLISSIAVLLPEYIEDPPINNLLEPINLYSSKTLRALEVAGYALPYEYAFDNFTKPFTKMENVTLFGFFRRLDGSKFKFGELFPSLRRFVLRATQTDISFINENLPHLVHFDASISSYNFPNRMTDAVFRKFIKNNLQLLSLRLRYSTHDLLKFINDELPKLNNLKLIDHTEYPSDGDKYNIKFDNVKRFVIRESRHGMPANITFDNLVEFETDAMPRNSLRWLDFVTKSKTVEKLKLNGRYIEKEEFEQIGSHNQNLLEFYGRCKLDVNPQSMVAFMKNGRRLEKITFEFDTDELGIEAFVEIMKVLEKNFSQMWEIHGNADEFKIELSKKVKLR